MNEAIVPVPAADGEPPGAHPQPEEFGDDVEAALLAARQLIEATVAKHRHRKVQDSLITAVGAAREDVMDASLRLVGAARRTIDVVLADAEYVDVVRAAGAVLVSEKPDVRVRLLCTQAVLDMGLIHRSLLAHPATEVRVARMSMLQAMLVDDEAAMVTAPSAVGRQVSVIRAATVISTLGMLFEGLWRHAVAVGERVDFGDRNRARTSRRILECLQAGVTDEVAARELAVSVRTYRRHVAEIMTLLGASSRFQAGVRAAELGLLPAASGAGRRPVAAEAPGAPGA
ncbi:transcriptional regulator [Streptomyces durbertensis]|uniref:transcriptional regulator n=1 Tax=Streptomyces durbertensis TaxID=2448886 RepID=UPI002B20E6D3|nr:transcriptional regulator [Streptomyces durbertensis]